MENRARIVFAKVREVLNEIKTVCLAPDRPDLSIEDFQLIVSRLYGGIPIKKVRVDYEAENMLGMVERHADKIVIYVKDSDDVKDLRFIATKELCHGLIDNDDDHSSNGVQTIEYLLEEYRIIKNVNAESAAQIEVLAELAAIEMLYPYTERCLDKSKIADGLLTIEEIANFYKIPDFIVERSHETWFHELATTIWGFVDQHETIEA